MLFTYGLRRLVGFYTDGEKRVRPITRSLRREVVVKRYRPKHGEPKLSVSKFAQRRAAARLVRQDVIVELNAGRGYISQAYRVPHSKHILVDADPYVLAVAKRRLGRDPRKEYYVMDNDRWIDEVLPSYQGRVTLVDFDPYGGCGKTIQHFFEHYKVTRPMVVTLTDGSVADWRHVAVTDFYAWYKSRKKRPSPRDIPDMIDGLFKHLGRRHGFKAVKVDGVWKEDRHAYYATYVLKPT